MNSESMMRRVKRLEDASESERNESGQTPADVLQERIRRMAEGDGAPYVEPPPMRFTDDRGRPYSVAEILRGAGRAEPERGPMKTITVPEMTEDLGVGQAKVYAMLRDQQIPCLRNGNRYIIGRVAFERWLENLGLNQVGAQSEAALQ